MRGTILEISERVRIPLSEVTFRTSRSGGPGGQHVNKLETRVELMFDVKNSPSLTDADRERIVGRLKSNVDPNGMLRLVAQDSRSQWRNKRTVVARFERLLRWALMPRKQRVQTAPTARSKEERIHAKKMKSIKKKLRRVENTDA